MTLAREIRVLAWRKLLETWPSAAWVCAGLATPLLYLGLFAWATARYREAAT